MKKSNEFCIFFCMRNFFKRTFGFENPFAVHDVWLLKYCFYEFTEFHS